MISEACAPLIRLPPPSPASGEKGQAASTVATRAADVSPGHVPLPACGERIRVRVEVPIHGMFFIISGLIGIMFVFR
jgi:hypothetical protein